MSDQQQIEKYQKAWEKFQQTMADLRKQRHEILTRISEKLDKQRMEKLRKKMQDHDQ